MVRNRSARTWSGDKDSSESSRRATDSFVPRSHLDRFETKRGPAASTYVRIHLASRSVYVLHCATCLQVPIMRYGVHAFMIVSARSQLASISSAAQIPWLPCLPSAPDRPVGEDRRRAMAGQTWLQSADCLPEALPAPATPRRECKWQFLSKWQMFILLFIISEIGKTKKKCKWQFN